MSIEITGVVVEIVAKKLNESLAFYELLGLEVPRADVPHVEIELPGGNKLAFDTEESIAGMQLDTPRRPCNQLAYP